MTNDLAVLITEIDANMSHAESLAAGLSHQQFNWRPDPASWSIGQCLSHLNVVDGQDLAPVRAAIDDGKSRQLTGEGPFSYGFLSRKFVASMEPPAKRKFKASKSYVPPEESDPQATLAEFRRISKDLRALAQSAAGLNLARVKTSLPALPAVLARLRQDAAGSTLRTDYRSRPTTPVASRNGPQPPGVPQ